MAQPDVLVDVNPLIVRTTMRDHIAHAFKQAGVDATSRPAGKRDPINSAHIFLVPRFSSTRSIQRAHATVQLCARRPRASARQAKLIPRGSNRFRQTVTKCTRNLKSANPFALLQRRRDRELSTHRDQSHYALQSRGRQSPRFVRLCLECLQAEATETS